jgi:hypothetical protein
VVKGLRANGDAARAIVAPSLQHYLVDRVLVTDWYPEEDFLALATALAPLLRQEDPWDMMGRSAAATDLGGIYRALISPGDPRRTLRLGGDLWRLYHDSGRLDITQDGDGAATIELHDLPFVSREICRGFAGYLGELLRIAGAREVKMTKRACRARGDALCAWDARWSGEG